MSRPVKPAWLLLPLALGCSDAPPEIAPLSDDAFWIELAPAPEGAECTSAVAHNFDDAVTIEEVSGLTEFERRNESAAGNYGYVTRQGPNGLLLNFGGDVYSGRYVDERTIDVAWRSSVELEEGAESVEGYSFVGIGAQQLEEVLVLTSTGEPDAPFEGTLQVREFEDADYRETDEWDSFATGVFFSSMPAFDYLEPADGFGNVVNQAEGPQCAAEECELSVLVDCTQTLTVRAWPIDGGIEAFEALDAYGREGGVAEETPATAP